MTAGAFCFRGAGRRSRDIDVTENLIQRSSRAACLDLRADRCRPGLVMHYFPDPALADENIRRDQKIPRDLLETDHAGGIAMHLGPGVMAQKRRRNRIADNRDPAFHDVVAAE